MAKIIVTVAGQVRGTNAQASFGFTADEGSLTNTWGLQPGSALLSWVKEADDSRVILPLAALTIEIGGHTTRTHLVRTNYQQLAILNLPANWQKIRANTHPAVIPTFTAFSKREKVTGRMEGLLVEPPSQQFACESRAVADTRNAERNMFGA